jgi:hypothetical protein
VGPLAWFGQNGTTTHLDSDDGSWGDEARGLAARCAADERREAGHERLRGVHGGVAGALVLGVVVVEAPDYAAQRDDESEG